MLPLRCLALSATNLCAAAGGATIWERILRHKAPVIEPRDSGAFAAAIADYTAKLDDPTGGGAVLFAVCRGKVCACICSVCACILPGVLYLFIFHVWWAR
jgi:regulator of telomere elongation helicase 1